MIPPPVGLVRGQRTVKGKYIFRRDERSEKGGEKAFGGQIDKDLPAFLIMACGPTIKKGRPAFLLVQLKKCRTTGK